MPLPSSSLVAIQDQLLVAKNNNNLVAPSPPLVSSCVIPGELEHRGTAGSQPPQVGLSGCFSSHSAPSAERLQRHSAVPATCDEDSWLSRPVPVPSTRQSVHIASRIFSDGNIVWQCCLVPVPSSTRQPVHNTSTTFFRWKPWMAMAAKESCDQI